MLQFSARPTCKFCMPTKKFDCVIYFLLYQFLDEFLYKNRFVLPSHSVTSQFVVYCREQNHTRASQEFKTYIVLVCCYKNNVMDKNFHLHIHRTLGLKSCTCQFSFVCVHPSQTFNGPTSIPVKWVCEFFSSVP